MVEVRLARQRATDGLESAIGAETRWFYPDTSLPIGLEVTEGPIDSKADTMVVLARNTLGEPLPLHP